MWCCLALCLRWGVTSVVVHVLLPAVLVALAMLGLFVVLDHQQRPDAVECVSMEEVEGLLELKQRHGQADWKH